MRVSLSTPRHRRHLAVLSALSLAFAVWAGWALSAQKLAADGVILFSLALALFFWTVPGDELLVVPARSTPPGSAVRRVDRTSLAACVILALLTFLLSTGNRFRPEAVAAWFLAIAFCIRAFWDPGDTPGLTRFVERLRRGEPPFSLTWSMLGLAAVMLVAAFFRYYQIGAIPPEPTSDHAEKLLDVRDILNGQFSIFFPRNTGREAIQFYLAVPFVRLFDLTHLALKVEQATVSLLAVPLVYLIGKEIGGARYGLLAAFFLAVSRWDVAIARVGLRFPLYPFFVALAFYFLLRGLRRGTRNDFLLCGLATGAGMYGYSPFRAMGLVILALVVVKLIFDWRAGRPGGRSLLGNAGICIGAAAVVFVPLGRYMSERPDLFWFRALTRMASAESPLPDDPFRVFVSNVLNALLMFNWRGDVVWVNTVPYDPVLDFVAGGLFLLGVGWCVRSLLRHSEPIAAYLLVSLPILLLPSILSLSFPGENPSVVRTGGAGPIVALLVAAPAYMAARRMSESWRGGFGKVLSVAVLGVLMFVSARANYERYFVAYPDQYRQSSVNSTEMAAVINGFAESVGSQRGAYIKSYPYWVDTRNVAFEIGNPDWNNVLMTPEDIARHTPPAGNKLYIMHKDDTEALAAFQRRFPSGQLRVQASVTAGKEFLVFFVPAER